MDINYFILLQSHFYPRAGTRGDRALTQRPAPGPCQAAGVTLSASAVTVRQGCFQVNYSLQANDFDRDSG